MPPKPSNNTEAGRKKRNANRIADAKRLVKRAMMQRRNPDGTFRPPKISKYRAQRVTIDGITFDSKIEAARWLQLVRMQKMGIISHLERQVPFPCHVRGQLITTYFADFRYRIKPGQMGQRTIIEEVKGVATDLYKIKKKLVHALHEIEIIELKVRTMDVSRLHTITADQFHTAKDQPDDDQVRVAGGEDA